MCCVCAPPTLQGQGAWQAAKATVCLLIPSTGSHRGHLACWAHKRCTLTRTQKHTHTDTQSHSCTLTHRRTQAVPGGTGSGAADSDTYSSALS